MRTAKAEDKIADSLSLFEPMADLKGRKREMLHGIYGAWRNA